jgi:hypothetical protein
MTALTELLILSHLFVGLLAFVSGMWLGVYSEKKNK